jgi:FtsH-binding integral membrane protein
MYATTGVYRSASQINSAMGRVFGHMGLAVVTSMIVSMLVAGSPGLMALLFGTALKWVVIFAPLVAILALSFGLEKLTKTQATVALHGFAALMGVSFATIFVVYNLGSIVSAFMGAAVLFGTMAFYGYFTKRDLSGVGQFLFIGLIAIVIASIINIFIGSSVAQMVISALAIIIFTGLTAYDTQNIRQMVSVDNPGNLEIAGALSLYLNFINIFLSLLQLFGQKND